MLKYILKLFWVACVGSSMSWAWAESYPSKSVRVIIPFPPGGTLDTVGRLLAQKLSDQLGQTFVVENKPGGNGIIGADVVAKSAADGYTLLSVATNLTFTPALNPGFLYDPAPSLDVALDQHQELFRTPALGGNALAGELVAGGAGSLEDFPALCDIGRLEFRGREQFLPFFVIARDLFGPGGIDVIGEFEGGKRQFRYSGRRLRGFFGGLSAADCREQEGREIEAEAHMMVFIRKG